MPQLSEQALEPGPEFSMSASTELVEFLKRETRERDYTDILLTHLTLALNKVSELELAAALASSHQP